MVSYSYSFSLWFYLAGFGSSTFPLRKGEKRKRFFEFASAGILHIISVKCILRYSVGGESFWAWLPRFWSNFLLFVCPFDFLLLRGFRLCIRVFKTGIYSVFYVYKFGFILLQSQLIYAALTCIRFLAEKERIIQSSTCLYVLFLVPSKSFVADIIHNFGQKARFEDWRNIFHKQNPLLFEKTSFSLDLFGSWSFCIF